MKKTSIIKLEPEAGMGIRKARSDIIGASKLLYHWGAKEVTKKVLGSGKRPRGIPKVKTFDGFPYRFYASFTSKLDASEMANSIRYHGNYSRVEQHGRNWIVWTGEGY